MDISQLGTLLNVIIGGTVIAAVTAGVAAIRKWKAGEIVDDDAIIARLYKDNENLRAELFQEHTTHLRTRRLLWKAEDQGAIWRRQLIENNIKPITMESSDERQ